MADEELIELAEWDPNPTFPASRELKQSIKNCKRIVVTSALNNTEIHDQFWENLLDYCEFMDAALLVIPVRYKNPTDPNRFRADRGSHYSEVFGENKYEYWWPSEIEPFLCDEDVQLHEKLFVMGRLRKEATVSNPLAGVKPLTQGRSVIVGHANVAMECVANPTSTLPSIMHSTGSLSRRNNYSVTGRGYIGEFHHSFGFCVVEPDGEYFHLRHVSANEDGSFTDLENHFAGDRVEYRTAAGIVEGDFHAWFRCPVVARATHGMYEAFRPGIRVLHDVFDAYSISHHHDRQFFTRFAKHASDHHLLRDELAYTRDEIRRTRPPNCEDWIIGSNHNGHFMRWLQDVDIRKEPWNAEVYHEVSLALLRETRMTNSQAYYPDAFETWCKMNGMDEVRFISPNDPDGQICGIGLTLHGDKGVNGARGSAPGLAQLGMKVVVGHAHSPCIRLGLTQVGTSTPLQIEYNAPPSTWMNTHCIIHETGKRQLLNIMPDGSWRLAP